MLVADIDLKIKIGNKILNWKFKFRMGNKVESKLILEVFHSFKQLVCYYLEHKFIRLNVK